MYNRSPTVVMAMSNEHHFMTEDDHHHHHDYHSEDSSGEHHHHGDPEKSGHEGYDETRQSESSRIPGQVEGQHRVQLACLRCRKQKLKCDGASPACGRCVKRNAECVYSSEPTGRKNGSKKKTTRRDKKKEEDGPARGHKAVKTEFDDDTYSPSSKMNGAAEVYYSGARGSPGASRGWNARGNMKELVLPSERQAPQLVALEQLSRKLKFELDSYTTMAKHWQEQLNLLKKGGLSAVTDKQAVATLKREMKPRMVEIGGKRRPRYLPDRHGGEPWKSYTSEAHPAIHLAQSMVAFSDRALVANPLSTMQDPSQVDLRCHRFRLMRFWDMASPRELLTDDLSYDILVAVWDILLQPISTMIQGNTFLDHVGRHLEDDLEETRRIDSLAIFAHTADLEEVLSVMEFGCLFFHATQLIGWEDQMNHLITNVDRLMHVAFFQRNLSTNAELADRTVNFVNMYVWRYKAFKMMTAYATLLNLGYQTLLSNFDHVSPNIAASINTMLVTTASSHAHMMHHVHLAERIEHTPLKKALLALAIGIVTLNRSDSPIHQYEKLESDYPELLRIISSIENPFDPDNHAIAATALFLHAEVLVRLGREISVVEELISEAIKDVVSTKACNAVHLLFSNMFMFQATVNTVVQFSNGISCTVSDYARIELAKALGFPLSSCTNIHNDTSHSDSPCKLKFSEEFSAALSRIGQFQPCNCPTSEADGEGSAAEHCTTHGSSNHQGDNQCTFSNPEAYSEFPKSSCSGFSSEVVTPNSEGHPHYHHVSPIPQQTVYGEQLKQEDGEDAAMSPQRFLASSLGASADVILSEPHSTSGWSSSSSPFPNTPNGGAHMPTDQDSVSASSTYFPEDYARADGYHSARTDYSSSHQEYPSSGPSPATYSGHFPADDVLMSHSSSIPFSSSSLADSDIFYTDTTTAPPLDAPAYLLSMSGDQLPAWNSATVYSEEF